MGSKGRSPIQPDRDEVGYKFDVKSGIFSNATAVSDLPEILENCGWIVEPEKPEELAATIQYVIENPDLASNMGQKARNKCIEKYSFDAREKVLVEIFKEYE